jgi:hypothetical protein
MGLETLIKRNHSGAQARDAGKLLSRYLHPKGSSDRSELLFCWRLHLRISPPLQLLSKLFFVMATHAVTQRPQGCWGLSDAKQSVGAKI